MVLDPSNPKSLDFSRVFLKQKRRGQVPGPSLEESNQDSDLAEGGERLRTEVGQAIHAPKAARGQVSLVGISCV